jgi:hypothetical protein
MEYLKFEKDILTFRELDYTISEITEIDGMQVDVYLTNSGYNFQITLLANEVSINDVVQTSAQMIFDTLTNNDKA